ncbi:MAG: outer membrane beta-barrel domain-containing protein [Bdellovibrionales bacterium]
MRRWTATLCFFISFQAWAQGGSTAGSSSTSETSDIDSALEQSLKKPESTQESPPEAETRTLPEVKDVSGLGTLSEFKDIAVIQKRYLPKTGRFELFPNLGFIINDAFFTNTALSGRAAYYFTESYSVELNAMLIGTRERKVTSDLNNERGIVTRTLVAPQYYYGADFKWTPIYGKMGYFDHKIIPFDFYFSAGYGMTKTNQGTNAGTIHLGTGQTYAMSKWIALRWDVSWYMYSTASSAGTSSSFTNIYTMLGASFFFPEATYR